MRIGVTSSTTYWFTSVLVSKSFWASGMVKSKLILGLNTSGNVYLVYMANKEYVYIVDKRFTYCRKFSLKSLPHTPFRPSSHHFQAFLTPPSGLPHTTFRPSSHPLQAFLAPPPGLPCTPFRPSLHPLQAFLTPLSGLPHTPSGLRSSHPLQAFDHHTPLRPSILTPPSGLQSSHPLQAFDPHTPFRPSILTPPSGL